MSEEATFLIMEVWLDLSRLEDFKAYRVRLFDLVDKFKFEYAYHGHPFAWALNTDDGEVPTGIEIWRFESEAAARETLSAIEKSGLLEEGKKVLKKSRCYLAKYALPSYPYPR